MEKMISEFVRRFDVRRKFFRMLHGSAKVLDLGCGTGVNGIAMKELYPSIDLYEVDLLPASNVPSFYSYQIIDIDNAPLPFPSDFFDAVVFTHVIEHLRSPLHFGREINRVMKTKALFYVETPNWTTVLVPSFGFHREQHYPFNFYDDPTHIKPWSKGGLFEFLFQNCGLRVLKVKTRRSWIRVPFDFLIIFLGLLNGKRSYVVSSFWNLYGWCIYGIGIKE